jgi:hypothetical protein
VRLLKAALPRNEWTNASVAAGVTEPVVKTHLIPQIDGKQKSENCRHLVSDHESLLLEVPTCLRIRGFSK